MSRSKEKKILKVLKRFKNEYKIVLGYEELYLTFYQSKKFKCAVQHAPVYN